MNSRRNTLSNLAWRGGSTKSEAEKDDVGERERDSYITLARLKETARVGESATGEYDCRASVPEEKYLTKGAGKWGGWWRSLASELVSRSSVTVAGEESPARYRRSDAEERVSSGDEERGKTLERRSERKNCEPMENTCRYLVLVTPSYVFPLANKYPLSLAFSFFLSFSFSSSFRSHVFPFTYTLSNGRLFCIRDTYHLRVRRAPLSQNRSVWRNNMRCHGRARLNDQKLSTRTKLGWDFFVINVGRETSDANKGLISSLRLLATNRE